MNAAPAWDTPPPITIRSTVVRERKQVDAPGNDASGGFEDVEGDRIAGGGAANTSPAPVTFRSRAASKASRLPFRPVAQPGGSC